MRPEKSRVTERVGLLKNACIILVICAATATAAPAQSFTTLYSFDITHGEVPYAGLIQATDGNFYGTTWGGGVYTNSNCIAAGGCGTVFQITPAGTLTTLHSFDSTDGAHPFAGLIQASDGNFYGTTRFGGAYSNSISCSDKPCGTVFRITPAGVLTTLYSFCAQTGCSDGAQPFAGLIQANDGNFYGTTYYGGTSGYGTIFKITPAGVLTTLYTFCTQTGCTDGAMPRAGLMQATDGNLYGTTFGGGANGNGTVFKITTGGTLTMLHSFASTDGANPYSGLMQATDGNLYGTTYHGGFNNCTGDPGCGTVFKITPGGTLTTLYSFCGQTGCPDGSWPSGLIQATDGNFYGTNWGDGANNCYYGCGTVFEITPEGMLGTLHNFQLPKHPASNDASPNAVIQGTDGNLYGTTGGGGYSQSTGTVFRLAVVPAVTLSPTSLNFGNQALDETSATKTVTLKNSGTALLITSGAAIDGGGFAISANTCPEVLGVGKTCKVSVTFTPTVLGKLTGKLTFTDNTSNSPQTVSLTGTGAVAATLTPISLNYGQQAVGTPSLPKTFTLTNNQSIALTGITITTTGDFTISATTCTTSLAAKAHCTINVTFTPTVLGKRTGILTVIDSANNSPQTASLTGTGAVAAALTPTFSIWYAPQAVGTTSLPKTFTLTNNQSVSLDNITISTTGDFAMSGTTCTTSLTAKNKCTISVTFTPTATGTRTGKLTVSDSANNSPQTANLSGTGK